MSRIKRFLFAGMTGWQRTALGFFWLIVFAIPVGVVLLFVGLSFTDLPSVTELENPEE